MFRVFNMGIGLVLIVADYYAEAIARYLRDGGRAAGLGHRRGRPRRPDRGVGGGRTLKGPSRSGRLSAFAGGRVGPPAEDPGRETYPMALTRDEVAKVALLARLRLRPDELETFTGQLNSIVEFVAQLQELDTRDVEPLAHGVEVRNVFRDDVRGPSLPREDGPGQRPQAQRRELPRPRRPGMTAPSD